MQHDVFVMTFACALCDIHVNFDADRRRWPTVRSWTQVVFAVYHKGSPVTLSLLLHTYSESLQPMM